MTKTPTNCPADSNTTGGILNRMGAYEGLAWDQCILLAINPIDAPEWLPAGSSDAYGGTLTLRSDLC